MSFKDTSRKNTLKIYFFKLAFKLKFFGKKKNIKSFLNFLNIRLNYWVLKASSDTRIIVYSVSVQRVIQNILESIRF